MVDAHTDQATRLGRASKIAEEKLDMLRFAGAMVRVGAWVVDLAENRITWSDEVCRIHECPIGTNPTIEEGINFYAPEWRDAIKSAFSRCARDGVPYDMELQIITAKGRRVWVRTCGEAERDHAGTIVRAWGAFQDITDLKQARDEALHLAARLTNILESITDAFFTVDRDWKFTYINKEAETLLKRSRADLLGKSIWDEFKEAVGTISDTEYRRALERNVTVAFETYYPPLEGWFQVRAYPSTEGLAVYFLNVTAERAAKKALEESEARFRAVAETSTVAIWDWNIEANSVWWNSRIQTLFGYDIAEMQSGIGCWTRHIHQDDRERVIAELNRQLHSGGETYAGEYRFIRNDGSIAHIVDRGFITRDKSGRAVRIVSRMSDRTRSYNAQKQLRDRAALLDKASNAILLRSLDHRILYWNAGAERLYGWTATEAIGRSIDELGYNDPLLFHEATDATIKSGEWAGEMTHRRKSGESVKVEVHWTLVRDDEGRPQAILAINSDMTKRIEAEEQSLRSQRLEAIGQLTGGIAHDFNNLLTVILGNSEVLFERLSGDERLSSLAAMIRTAAERGADLTNHLLSYARRQALDPTAVNVNELARKMDGLLRRTLGEHIELEFVGTDGLWKALADPTQLESAILNVCINARDAMPDGGRLVIEAANVWLDQTTVETQDDVRPGNYVMLAITDTGCGMSEDVIAHAFEPFFTTKEIGKGSGLGLSMVYGFAKQSGGYARVHSEAGRGTVIKLYLPRVDQPSETMSQEPIKNTAMPTGMEKILLVEDEDLVRKYAYQLLTNLGYQVLAVGSGPEAIATLREGVDCDLMFTDIVMPGGLNGWQLADEARRIRPSLKVLFTSGYIDKGPEDGLRPGIQLLHKPYKPQTLAAKIRLVLDEAP